MRAGDMKEQGQTKSCAALPVGYNRVSNVTEILPASTLN